MALRNLALRLMLGLKFTKPGWVPGRSRCPHAVGGFSWDTTVDLVAGVAQEQAERANSFAPRVRALALAIYDIDGGHAGCGGV